MEITKKTGFYLAGFRSNTLSMKHVFSKLAIFCFFTTLISLLCLCQAKATHVMGGQITATPVSGQNFTYHLKFTLYTDPDADIEFGTMEISFGHGDPANLDGENDFQRAFLNADSLVMKDTLLMTHTFPGPGKYLISLREFNRSAEIANMRNSVNTSFYIETLLTIDPAMGENSSPILSDSVVFNAHVKTRFTHEIGAHDPDGDSLSYALLIPKQDTDRNVYMYAFPDQFDTLYAENPGQEDGTFLPLFAIENGQLIWDAPTYGGKYTSAVQVKEWRQIEGQWQQIGYVIRDLTIYVEDTINNTNGLDYVDYDDYVTDTENEMGKRDIVLFPNPTNGKVHLKTGEPWIGSQLSILDISGKMVYQAEVTKDEVILELPHLSNGLYVLTLQKGFKKRSFTLVKR